MRWVDDGKRRGVEVLLEIDAEGTAADVVTKMDEK